MGLMSKQAATVSKVTMNPRRKQKLDSRGAFFNRQVGEGILIIAIGRMGRYLTDSQPAGQTERQKGDRCQSCIASAHLGLVSRWVSLAPGRPTVWPQSSWVALLGRLKFGLRVEIPKLLTL